MARMRALSMAPWPGIARSNTRSVVGSSQSQTWKADPPARAGADARGGRGAGLRAALGGGVGGPRYNSFGPRRRWATSGGGSAGRHLLTPEPALAAAAAPTPRRPSPRALAPRPRPGRRWIRRARGACRGLRREPAGGVLRGSGRAASPGTALLDWRERTDLARKWAAMPGLAIVDPDVVSACAGKLAP